MADYARSQLAATDLLLRQQITGLAVEPGAVGLRPQHPF